jgi:streptomycin 6-kinase
VRVATAWGLELGEPYALSGQAACVAPATNAAGDDLVLKIGWRHFEAEHEADALHLWDGDGAVRGLRAETFEDTTALLLERCVPGGPLREAMPEPEQDVVVAAVLRRLWDHEPPPGHPFRTLQEMCSRWAAECERHEPSKHESFDRGLTRAAIELLRELPSTATRRVLLATDLHAGNILAAERQPWLAIDPKPFVGDPAYDPVQHMLNCDERLATDPVGLARRMADLLELDRARTTMWLFARCAQESANDPSMREPAQRLAP